MLRSLPLSRYRRPLARWPDPHGQYLPDSPYTARESLHCPDRPSAHTAEEPRLPGCVSVGEQREAAKVLSPL